MRLLHVLGGPMSAPERPDSAESGAPTWRDVAAKRPEVMQAYVQAHGPMPEGPVQEADWQRFWTWLQRSLARVTSPADGGTDG